MCGKYITVFSPSISLFFFPRKTHHNSHDYKIIFLPRHKTSYPSKESKTVVYFSLSDRCKNKVYILGEKFMCEVETIHIIVEFILNE